MKTFRMFVVLVFGLLFSGCLFDFDIGITPDVNELEATPTVSYVGFPVGVEIPNGAFEYDGPMISGGHYKGWLLDGLPHDESGIYTWANGDVYIGPFRNGVKHGKGTYDWSTEEKFVGMFGNGEIHGSGTYTCDDGVYVGWFKNGGKNGDGEFSWANGDKFVGWFEDDEMGRGTYAWNYGNIYKGPLRYGKINGKGSFESSNEEKYVGYFRDGKANGQGEWSFDGWKYSGWFYEGLPYGKSILTSSDGREFEGFFQLDNEAIGTFKFEGVVVFGILNTKDSFGEISYPDKRVYKGKFRNGGLFGEKISDGWEDKLPNGFGRMTWPNGTVKIGEWNEGEFVGALKIVYMGH